MQWDPFGIARRYDAGADRHNTPAPTRVRTYGWHGAGRETKGGTVTDSSDSGLVGRIVVDLRHEPIGKVVDVIFEDAGPDPKLAVIDPGLFRSSRYVPLARFGRTGDGRIVLPFEADVVLSGPKAPKEHIVTRELEDRVADHYPSDD